MRQGVHSINPKNNRLLRTFSFNKDSDISSRIARSQNRFSFNQNFTVEQLPERHFKLLQLENILLKNKEMYARLMVDEMGKPI